MQARRHGVEVSVWRVLALSVRPVRQADPGLPDLTAVIRV
jgi:hypothetical protein